MPIPQIPPLNQDADLAQVKNYVIRLERTLNFLLENGLDSENVFEVGGWRVGSDTLSSKDKDVGMTTEGSSGSSIRLWAGSTDPNTAPWRVSRDGTAYMTGAEIYNELSGGAYTSIGSGGITVNDGSRNTFRVDVTGQVTMTGATIVNNLTSGAYTTISDNGITINDGTINTFRADVTGQVTMTGALIRSKTGFPAIVMNPSGDLVGAYVDINNYVSIVANDLGSPALNFGYGGSVVGQMNTRLGILSVEGRPDVEIFADTGDIYLTAGADVILNTSDWSNFKNQNESLQDSLNAKANSGTSTGLSGSHNHGIPNGTVLMVNGGGTVVWSVAGNHSHSQN